MPSQKEARTREERLEQDKEQDKEKGLESALRVAREALVSCKLSSGGMASSLYGAHRYNDGALALRTRTTTTTPVRVKMEGGRGMGRRCVLVEEEEEEEGRREEALKCFSGMPTPALRNAQRRFREALSAAIEVVNAQLQASGLREDYAAEYGSHKEDEGSSGSEQTAVGG
ncbi:hypothetical protein HOP50_10g57540 [Chloropicon primus]|uniref:Uncharacterized protein n=1 Tax=Chloropicon primus TaxID=1764295 RepID=A0A5B8MTY4_9CHLO|nr:hypothetical protein A3770_10p57320 [Chloropicon primus]UPR02428.1 hypothetical protein HOP50_10g57540 [Chloropicon primus]|eukprot:QDZ23214.1 hypothetical protein A3770_10p57320 [Chloropicon primus]